MSLRPVGQVTDDGFLGLKKRSGGCRSPRPGPNRRAPTYPPAKSLLISRGSFLAAGGLPSPRITCPHQLLDSPILPQRLDLPAV